MSRDREGFTLIELMVILAIMGILAGIAVIRFGGVLEKAKEGATRGALGSLRSALNIYYGDNSLYPSDDLSSLVENKKYIDNLPLVKLPGTTHPENRHVSVGASTAAAVTDTGGWAYVNDPASASFGTLLINCSHADSKGKSWAEQ
ncbi:MAG: type II secretion system GspH family protein [Elusimicrobiales bacterium]|nr:type II secretion system GspH family protein [Elusimicrobiales bacterium]